MTSMMNGKLALLSAIIVVAVVSAAYRDRGQVRVSRPCTLGGVADSIWDYISKYGALPDSLLEPRMAKMLPMQPEQLESLFIVNRKLFGKSEAELSMLKCSFPLVIQRRVLKTDKGTFLKYRSLLGDENLIDIDDFPLQNLDSLSQQEVVRIIVQAKD